MTSLKEFEIPGEPKGKGRPRATSRGGHTRVYTDSQTLSYEAETRFLYKNKIGEFFEGPVQMEIEVYQGIPKSTSKKKRQAMINQDILPMKKPDADNIAKIICDALNGVAYKDDTQICHLLIKKFYCEIPRVLIKIGSYSIGPKL